MIGLHEVPSHIGLPGSCFAPRASQNGASYTKSRAIFQSISKRMLQKALLIDLTGAVSPIK